MQEKDQIAELFKDTFNNYESPVRPELWQQVATRIQVPVSPAVPDGTSVIQMTTASSKIAGSVMAWVAGAAVIVTVATGYYFYDRGQKTETASSSAPVAVPENTGGATTIQAIEGNRANSLLTEPSAAEQKSGFSGDETVINATENQSAEQVITTSNNPANNAGNTVLNIEKQSVINEKSAGSPEVSNESSSSSNNAPKTPQDEVLRNNIMAIPASGYAPLQVTFSTKVSNETNEWQFGDGSEPMKGAMVQHSFNKPGTYQVILKSTDEKGHAHTEVVKVLVLSDLTITNIPNIFTPNGDGVNDVFAVKTDKDIDIEVSIFDKSGKFIYKYTGTENSWNGKINNLQDAGEGTYFYVIFATGLNGEQNTQKGTITLKR